MIYTYPGTEHGVQALDAIDALAAMYAENLSVASGTDFLFLCEAQGANFTREDLGLAEQSADREYARKALNGLMGIGVIETERGARQDTNNHSINTYNPTAEFPGVIASYNSTYMDHLAGVIGVHVQTVEKDALTGLASAHHLTGIPLARVPLAVSEKVKNVGEGGAVRRALAALAILHGAKDSVEEAIAQHVAEVHNATYQVSPRVTKVLYGRR